MGKHSLIMQVLFYTFLTFHLMHNAHDIKTVFIRQSCLFCLLIFLLLYLQKWSAISYSVLIYEYEIPIYWQALENNLFDKFVFKKHGPLLLVRFPLPLPVPLLLLLTLILLLHDDDVVALLVLDVLLLLLFLQVLHLEVGDKEVLKRVGPETNIILILIHAFVD